MDIIKQNKNPKPNIIEVEVWMNEDFQEYQKEGYTKYQALSRVIYSYEYHFEEYGKIIFNKNKNGVLFYKEIEDFK